MNWRGSLKQNKTAEKEFYNKHVIEDEDYRKATYYVKHHNLMLSRAKFFTSEIIEKESKNNLKVFEVGSNGDFSRFLQESYPNKKISLTIGDIAFMQLSQTDISAHKVNLDLEYLPFKDVAFDFVFIRGVLHHLPVIGACSKELMRVCSKSIIITNEPCGDNPVVIFSRWLSSLLSRFLKISTTVNETMHNIKTYKDSFHKSGAKSILFENGDEIFKDSESWGSFLLGIKKSQKMPLLLFLIIRAYLLRILMLNFSKYPFGWNTFFIFVKC